MDIHQYDNQYAGAIEGLNKSGISDKNKKLILSFLDDLVLENLSKSRLLKYLSTLRLVAEKIGKELDQAEIDDIKRFIGSVQQRSDYSVWTKQSYKVIVRRFYKWLKKTKDYPEIVSWINIGISRSEKKLPSEGDLMTPDDIQKLISFSEHPRDKAFVSVLWESGARIGEIGNLCLKNVAFDEFGTVITVRGKTGSRKIRLIASTPYLSTWMNNHPLKKDNSSPLWINVGNTKHNKQMAYSSMSVLLKRLVKKANIQKGFNPHLFRHSRATFMANYLTEFQMNQYFGWIQGSDMPSTYVHMSGKEVDSAVLAMNGIKTAETKEEEQAKPRICPRCDTINANESRHCNKCGGILDLKFAMELEEKRKHQTELRSNSDNVMDMLLKDKDVQALMMEKLRSLGTGISF